MDFIFSLLTLIIATWTKRSICIKQQSSDEKFGKSVLRYGVFLRSVKLWMLTQGCRDVRVRIAVDIRKFSVRTINLFCKNNSPIL